MKTFFLVLALFLAIATRAQTVLYVHDKAGVLANGSNDDGPALQSLFDGITSTATVYFDAGKTYLTGVALKVPSFVTIEGSGATLKPHTNLPLTANVALLDSKTGTPLNITSGVSINVVKGSNKFRYSGAGSLVVGRHTLVGGGTEYTTKTNSYANGFYGLVLAIVGDSVTMDTHYKGKSFTGTFIKQFTTASDIHIRNLKVDLRNRTTGNGIGLTNAKNSSVENCEVFSDAKTYKTAEIGFNIVGTNILLDHLRAHDLKTKDTAGNAIGYGINFAGNKVTVQYCYTTNVKHGITSAGRDYHSDSLKVLFDTTIQGLGQGATMDFHGQAHGYIVGGYFEAYPPNTITVDARATDMNILGNTIIYDNTKAGTTPVATAWAVFLQEGANNIVIKNNKIVVKEAGTRSIYAIANSSSQPNGPLNLTVDSNFITGTIALSGKLNATSIQYNRFDQRVLKFPFINAGGVTANASAIWSNNIFTNSTASGTFNYYIHTDTCKNANILEKVISNNVGYLSQSGNTYPQFRINGCGWTVISNTVHTALTTYNPINDLSGCGSGNNFTGNTKLAAASFPAAPAIPDLTKYSVDTTTLSSPVLVADAGGDTAIYLNITRNDSARLDASFSEGATSYAWSLVSYPAGTVAPTFTSMVSPTVWLTGINEGITKVRLSINGGAATVDKVIRAMDFMKKNVTATRAGGGIAIQVPPTSTGTYTKPNGTVGTWNKWNYLYDLPAYLQSKGLPAPMAGDTLYFEGGADSTAWVEIGNFGGNQTSPVYVMVGSATDASKRKPMNLRGAGAYFRIATRDSNVTCYAAIDGTNLRSLGYGYAFNFDNSGILDASIANGGVNANWVHHITLKGIRAVKYKWGMQILSNSTAFPASQYDKFINRKITIADNFIDSSIVEGMYIGNTSPDDSHASGFGPGARADSVSIYNNIVLNSGWDGIQLSNARSGNRIYNNFVSQTGIKTTDPSQQAGILMGANTNGNIDSNTVLRTRGVNIMHLGYGAVQIRYNVVDSAKRGDGSSDGLFLRGTANAYEVNPNLQGTITGNIIARFEREGIYLQNSLQSAGAINSNTFVDPTGGTVASYINNGVTSTLSGNVVKTSFPVSFYAAPLNATGYNLSVTQGTSGQSYDNDSAGAPHKINAWLLSRNGNVVANQPPTANAGPDQTITLPTNAVTVTGAATDADGTFTVRWTEVSGPTTYLITSATTQTTSIQNLVSGVYIFRFTVTDNMGAVKYDDMQITVGAARKTRRGQVAKL